MVLQKPLYLVTLVTVIKYSKSPSAGKSKSGNGVLHQNLVPKRVVLSWNSSNVSVYYPTVVEEKRIHQCLGWGRRNEMPGVKWTLRGLLFLHTIEKPTQSHSKFVNDVTAYRLRNCWFGYKLHANAQFCRRKWDKKIHHIRKGPILWEWK